MKINVKELRLSYSGANTWSSCRMKYYWNYEQNLRRKGTDRNLQIGSIVHELLHMHYVDEVIPADLEAYVEAKYRNEANSANGEGTSSVEVAFEALRLVQGYLQKYDTSDPLKVISSEMKIELPRKEPETGREYSVYMIIDAVARNQEGRLWRLEHKTAARVDSYYLSGLRSGLQGGIYHYGLNQVMPEPIVGTIYNMLVKTKIPNYQRMPVLMQQGLAERAVQTFDGVARQIFLGDVYPDAGACFNFNRECPYIPLCHQYKGEWNDGLERIKNSFFEEYGPKEEAKGGEGGTEEES